MTPELPAVPLGTVALKCCCPRCGKAPLFEGFLRVVERCQCCGLRFAGHDAGDGPAFFVMLPLCLFVAGAALGVELAFTPPLWVHMTVWPIVIAAVVMGSLRPIKAIMIALQYRHRDVEHYEA